jgi:hypothetical protein
MESSISLKRLIMKIKSNRALVVSLILLGLSILYCLMSFYFVSMDFSGEFLVTVILANIFGFIRNVLSTLQASAFFIWVTIAFLLIMMNKKHWVTILICSILIPIIFMVGTVYGLYALQIKFVDSVGYRSNLYHLNYIYNWQAENGYYNLLECDRLGLSCTRLFISPQRYSKADMNAQISINETASELSIIVEDKVLFRQRLE